MKKVTSTPNNTPAILEGKYCIGKSQVVKKIAIDLGTPCTDLRLSQNKITIHTRVYNQDNESDASAECAAFEINEEQLAEIKRYQEFMKVEPEIMELKLNTLKGFQSSWFKARPLLKPEEFDRYIPFEDIDSEDLDETYNFSEDPEEARVDGDFITITRKGFYIYTFEKYSGTKYVSGIVSTKALEDAMGAEPAPKAGFYFRADFKDYPQTADDAPKYINDSDPAIRLYSTYLLRSAQ